MTPDAVCHRLGEERLTRFISIYLTIWFAMHLFSGVYCLLSAPVNYDSYGITEYLINFEGGFVRRGMLGECLYFLQLHVLPRDSVTLIGIIYAVSFLCFGAAFAWYFRAFRMKGYCWWLLMSPFMFGFIADIVKKDFMLCLVAIVAMTLLRFADSGVWRRLGATVIIIIGLFLHEAFLFWGVPIIALVLVTDRKYRPLNLLLLAAIFVAAAFLFFFKGNPEQAQAIFASWRSLGLPLDPTYEENSIYALGWDSLRTFSMHFRSNYFQEEYTGWAGLVVRPLVYVIVYYFITNFLWPRNSGGKLTAEAEVARRNLSAAFLFLTLCLMPMFTVLSSDPGRIFQYLFMTSLAALLIFPAERMAAIFPEWWMRMADRINVALLRIVPPTRGLMLILLFTLSVAPYSFGQAAAFGNSILGYSISIAWRILHISF